VAQAWIQVFNTGRMGLDTAARALVSRAVGAGDMPQANDIARQCLIFNLAFAMVVMWVGIALSDVLLRILGVAQSVVEEGSVYQQLRFAGSFFFSVGMLSGSLLQAGGDTLTPMKARVVSRAVHILLTPVLMFGWGGLLPPLGISGGALANGIAQILAAWINLHALFTGTSRVHVSLDTLSLDSRLLIRQVQIGAPASVTSAERSLAQLMLVGLAAPFGQAGLAVYAVTQRIQMLGALGAHGLAQASGVIVGQNLGARQPDRAKATVWWAMAITFAFQSLFCLLIFLFPEAVIFIFSREPEVLELGATWLRIEVLAFLLFGIGNVLTLAFNTAGDTMVPMLAGLGGLWGTLAGSDAPGDRLAAGGGVAEEQTNFDG
jgi:putative MATE family efflux protein